MALIWSPFIAFGILFLFAPFIVLEICRQFRQDVFDKTATNTFGQYINRVNLWKFVKKNKISIVNTITGIIISAFTILYFKSKLPVLKDQIDFYWQLYPISSESIIRMVVFLFVDLFVFIPLIFSKQIHLENKEKRLALWAFILLVFIAQFHYGASNDWIIRVSMPALITLAFLIASKYKQLLQNKTWIRYFFITIVLLGSITPLSQALLLNQISNPATNEQPNQNMLNAHLKYGVIHQQYMGSASRLFGKWFGNYGVVENNNK